MEKLEECEFFFCKMCMDKEHKYRICFLPKCCGVCDLLKTCFGGCIKLEIMEDS
jgi:hypothetical protein